jgi:hypothetical protein
MAERWPVFLLACDLPEVEGLSFGMLERLIRESGSAIGKSKDLERLMSWITA